MGWRKATTFHFPQIFSSQDPGQDLVGHGKESLGNAPAGIYPLQESLGLQGLEDGFKALSFYPPSLFNAVGVYPMVVLRPTMAVSRAFSQGERVSSSTTGEGPSWTFWM